ncbi:alcohol dehydrogenase catalytic domain-containing protein [Amphritea sp. 1_MG-2023]|uniref:alcohol dehydrogenase catalytic domain-containing protein n=1 Tax=Amphritea sp. 1_MG-2023 TaxID=3062670 RepID=UPI0026E24CB6|nr:alcohol dehydrogenase catalytic domain-containing protein [Amphritea sp. 1_MG-2023]MDO6565169.1 alcohol dehydrogenase catalytic domain-containing protein [Amphritea sp. 1_MG-2023]
MKALVYTANNEITHRDEPSPEAAPGDALVRIEAAGICGSDMHAYHGHDPRRVPPLVLGHEACGVVLNGRYKGQRVVLNPLITCGECHDCMTGRTNLCHTRTAIGLARPGALAELTTIPEANLIPIPEDMNPVHAALAEPAATALHALALAERVTSRPLSEGRALVIGAGSIGLLVALFLKSKGCRDIVLSDTNPLRLATAAETGCCQTHNPMKDQPLDDSGFELVIDAVGASMTRKASVAAVKPGGVLVHVGLLDSAGELDVRKITLFEISFIGAFSYTQVDMQAAVKALYSGALGDLAWVETRRLDEGAQAFMDLDQGKTAAAKIVLCPS